MPTFSCISGVSRNLQSIVKVSIFFFKGDFTFRVYQSEAVTVTAVWNGSLLGASLSPCAQVCEEENR